jgi:hypothetical protein
MARTLEGLVECHRVADVRRRAGKPVWDRKIDIKEVLYRDQSNESDEHARAVGQEIAALLRASVPTAWLVGADDEFDWTLDEILDCLENVSSGGEDDPAVDALNSYLDDLYDWADVRRVWLGL